MIHILYLAAGQSRRYGSNKLLDDWNGKPLYRWGLETIREAIRE
ncbi:MAG: NTP transferase domain-containing protein, partial [Clostridia bacterium]|nr:NTP transferase domain-containing protein [Clostridia bacterium]